MVMNSVANSQNLVLSASTLHWILYCWDLTFDKKELKKGKKMCLKPTNQEGKVEDESEIKTTHKDF